MRRQVKLFAGLRVVGAEAGRIGAGHALHVNVGFGLAEIVVDAGYVGGDYVADRGFAVADFDAAVHIGGRQLGDFRLGVGKGQRELFDELGTVGGGIFVIL